MEDQKILLTDRIIKINMADQRGQKIRSKRDPLKNVLKSDRNKVKRDERPKRKVKIIGDNKETNTTSADENFETFDLNFEK